MYILCLRKPRNLELLWPQRDHKALFARVLCPSLAPETVTDGSAVLSATRWNGIAIEGYVAVYNGLAPISSLLSKKTTKQNGTVTSRRMPKTRGPTCPSRRRILRRAALRALLALLRPAARRLLRRLL